MVKVDNILFSKLDKLVIKCIRRYGLIADGDKILIGISGGKDSLALTELLANRAKIFAPKFSVVAVHIVMENIGYQSDIEYLKEFCNSCGVEFHVLTTSFDLSSDRRKSPCFLCSWYRRKAMFDFAKEMGCNKIALGHHRDDIIATFIMNMAFQGSISTMPPLLKMDKFDMEIIRPLSLIAEEDILQLSQYSGYVLQPKSCPYEKESFRSDVEGVIKSLEKLNPQVKANIWGAMENIQSDYLPKRVDKKG